MVSEKLMSLAKARRATAFHSCLEKHLYWVVSKLGYVKVTPEGNTRLTVFLFISQKAINKLFRMLGFINLVGVLSSHLSLPSSLICGTLINGLPLESYY